MSDWKICQRVKISMVKEGDMKYDAVKFPNDAVNIARRVIGNADREMIVVLCLSQSNDINAVNIAGVGSLSSAVVHPREIFKPAILSNAAHIIFVHNHPGGRVVPSEDDKKATNVIKKAGEVLDIPLVDSIIIGDDDAYYSFRNEGELM